MTYGKASEVIVGRDCPGETDRIRRCQPAIDKRGHFREQHIDLRCQR